VASKEHFKNKNIMAIEYFIQKNGHGSQHWELPVLASLTTYNVTFDVLPVPICDHGRIILF
jgi:hypothetical protein